MAVNGVTAKLGDRADPGRDEVTLDGERLHFERLDYWLLHKPVGVLTTVRDPEGRRTVLDLIPARTARLFPVGRLDAETSGLLLLTNDGALTQALLHPSNEVEREYEVSVRGELEDRAQERLQKGVRLEDGWTAPARLARVRYDAESDRSVFRLVLREGRKRQIRRSLGTLGHPVVALRRIRMGPLRLGALAPGAARRLTRAERESLARLVRDRGAPAEAHAQVRGNRSPKPRTRKRNPRSSKRDGG